MNGVAFFLRNKLRENRFADAVIAALDSPYIDNALVCSGFFQEDPSYSVSKSRFGKLTRCCSKLDLTTIGYYGAGRPAYDAFISGLRKHCACNKCLTLKPMRIPGSKWHAKVFIAKHGSDPALAAIGSSNMTRRAFDTLRNFNYECDVLFWDESIPTVRAIARRAIGEVANEFPNVVVARIDEKHPVNRVPLQRRLRALELEILAKAVPH